MPSPEPPNPDIPREPRTCPRCGCTWVPLDAEAEQAPDSLCPECFDAVGREWLEWDKRYGGRAGMTKGPCRLVEHRTNDVRVVLADGTELARFPSREKAVSYARGWMQAERRYAK